MIKKLFILFLLTGLFVSCAGDSEKQGNSDEQIADEANVKEEIPLLTIAEFNEEAGKYSGKEVRVEGIVDHICRHGGKRLLLVSDDGDLHVDGEERFDESIEGTEIIVTGIVDEFRVDEAYCLKLEEENIKAHNAGETNSSEFENTQKEIQFYRDSMQNAGIDHISYYSLTYVSHKEKE